MDRDISWASETKTASGSALSDAGLLRPLIFHVCVKASGSTPARRVTAFQRYPADANASRNGSVGWVPALGTRGFHRPVSDPSKDLQVRCHGSGRDGRDVPIAVVSGLLNGKKLLRCTFGDNLERRPKCWIGVLRVGGIVHVRQHCASVPPYGLIGRTSSSAPFRFSSVDNRHADEAQACRRRRVFEWRPFWAKGCNPLTPA